MSDICWLLRARRERPRKRRAADQQLTGEKGALRGLSRSGQRRMECRGHQNRGGYRAQTRQEHQGHRLRPIECEVCRRAYQPA
jgi:hypothetical protein